MFQKTNRRQLSCDGGWGTWIRTKTNRVRADCSTVKLSPKQTPRPALGDLAALGAVCKEPIWA